MATLIRPASTVLLAARIGSGALGVTKHPAAAAAKFDYKILMVKRSSKNRFMPNTHVFPGGVVETADNDPKWAQICGWKGDATDLAYRIAAIREVFEEVNVLISSKVTNLPVSELREWRLKVQKDASKFYDMCMHFNFKPEPSILGFYSHWITPEHEKYRYDTRFYVSTLPAEFTPTNSSAKIDDAEVTSLSWFSPEEALAAAKDGTIVLPPPTWVTLSVLSHFTSIDSLLSHCNTLLPYSPTTPITKQTILPFLPSMLPHDPAQNHNEEKHLVLVLPGDEAYPDSALAGSAGRRHRMILKGKGDFLYENSDFAPMHSRL